MKRILLTGSEGYIGINVQEYFRETNYEIVPLDARMGVEAEEYKDFEKDKIDGIIHLAATAGISQCEREPQEAVRNNFWSSCNMFESALLHGIPCIFTSSQAAKDPMSSMYALTKYTSEVSANIFMDKGADIKVLRLTNVYGGIGYLRKKNSVMAIFARATLQGESKVINGDGTQQRDFIHVEDVCRAIHLALESKPVDFPIDVGTGKGTSILELVKLFGGTFTFNPDSDTIGLSSNIANIADARKYISFEAVHNVESYVNAIKSMTMDEVIKLKL
jgi:UDP-glucose 4-epimerase